MFLSQTRNIVRKVFITINQLKYIRNMTYYVKINVRLTGAFNNVFVKAITVVMDLQVYA